MDSSNIKTECKWRSAIFIMDINRRIEHKLNETTTLIVSGGQVLRFFKYDKQLEFEHVQSEFNTNEVINITNILMNKYGIHSDCIELNNYFWNLFNDVEPGYMALGSIL